MNHAPKRPSTEALLRSCYSQTDLQKVIREHHEKIRSYLSRFQLAWLDGNVGRARRWFGRFEIAILNHLRWEQDALIQPYQGRISRGRGARVLRLAVESHQNVRHLLARIVILMPDRARGNLETDRHILELVEELEGVLESHRMLVETQLCVALESSLPPVALANVARQSRTDTRGKLD